jgi:hypothetical protein
VWSNVVAEALVCANTSVDDESQQLAQPILAKRPAPLKAPTCSACSVNEGA